MLETNANEPFAAAGMTAQRLRKRNLDIHSRTDCHGWTGTAHKRFFNAWSCQNGKSGLSKAAGTIMCHVLRCKPTSASSAGPNSHLDEVRGFFDGAGCESMPEALDDDEDESDELESENLVNNVF